MSSAADSQPTTRDGEGGDTYRLPVLVRDDEVSADLLARLALAPAAEVPTKVPTTSKAEKLRSRISSASRLKFLEHETGLEPATPTLATWRSTS